MLGSLAQEPIVRLNGTAVGARITGGRLIGSAPVCVLRNAPSRARRRGGSMGCCRGFPKTPSYLRRWIIRLVPETRMILSKPSFHAQQAASLSRLVLASVLA